MSRENVEVVRRIYEAVARRDSEAVLALYDADVVMEATQGNIAQLLTGGPVWRGHDGLRAFDREWREAFAEVETRCEELIDVGDQVIAIARYHMRGRASGIKVSGPPQAGVWTLRAGKVVHVVWFAKRDEALASVGQRLEQTEPLDDAHHRVDILRRAAQAIGENDVETLMGVVTDDFELHPGFARAFVGATTYRGKEGARRYLEDVKGVFADLRFEPLSFSAWRDYMICPTRVTGHGTASGASIDHEMIAIWRWRQDLVCWGGTFFDRDEALGAIGATEEALAPIE